MMGAIDNLVKGAAGQAVQNMNLMFGFKETKDYYRYLCIRKIREDYIIMKEIEGGVTAPKGFLAAAAAAGIKYQGQYRYGNDLQPDSLRGSWHIHYECGQGGSCEMGSGDRYISSRDMLRQ